MVTTLYGTMRPLHEAARIIAAWLVAVAKGMAPIPLILTGAEQARALRRKLSLNTQSRVCRTGYLKVLH